MGWDNEKRLEKNDPICENNGLEMLWWMSQEIPDWSTIKNPPCEKQGRGWCREDCLALGWNGKWRILCSGQCLRGVHSHQKLLEIGWCEVNWGGTQKGQPRLLDQSVEGQLPNWEKIARGLFPLVVLWYVPRSKSHLIISTLSPSGFTPITPFYAPQVATIGPDHAWPMPHVPLIVLRFVARTLVGMCSLWTRGFRHHPRSHCHHVMIAQPCATQATSSVDLGPEGSNSLSWQSISILLHANAYLIALQQVVSIPAFTPDLKTDCMHPCVLFISLSPSPHVESCHSYRLPSSLHPNSIMLSLWPCWCHSLQVVLWIYCISIVQLS